MNRKRLILAIALAIVLVLAMVSVMLGNTWQWSEVGAHHRSIVKINGGGSGVYIQHGTLFGVLTAGHCADAREKSVTFSNGSQASGEARHCKNGYDLGFIVVKSDAVRPIKLAAKAAATGERVEFVSYGGQDRRLRHFWSTAIGGRGVTEGRFVWYSAPVTNGDSGCAILNTAHELVGIEAVGNKTLTGPREWPVYRNGGAAPFPALCDFVARVEKVVHGAGRPDCPSDCPNCPRGRIQGGWDFYPPPGSNPVPNPGPLPEVPRELPSRLPIEPAAVDPCKELRGQVEALRAQVVALERKLTDPRPIPHWEVFMMQHFEDLREIVEAGGSTPGPPGADGKDGLDGKPAVVDYGEIVKRLPGLIIPTYVEGSAEPDMIEYKLGSTLPPLWYLDKYEVTFPDGKRQVKQIPGSPFPMYLGDHYLKRNYPVEGMAR
jgi:hypothetical protein